MPLLAHAKSLIRNLFRRDRADRDTDEELRSYLDLLTEEKIASGQDPAQARRQAKIELGGLEQVKESILEDRPTAFIDSVAQDLRYAFRLFRRSPAFTAATILTLALGMGANAAIFSLVDSVFFRALPFPDLDRLVHVWTTNSDGDLHTPSPTQYEAVRNDAQSFEQVAGVGWAEFFYGINEPATQTLPGQLVTSNWLSTLGIQPFLGRDFFAEEQRAGHDAVVLLSYRCWRTRFHADPHVTQRQILLNRRLVTVIGVLPQSLEPYYDGAEVFAPLVLASYATNGLIRDGSIRVQTVARLKPGVSLAQARAESEFISQNLRSASQSDALSGRLVIEDFADALRDPGPTMQNARHGLAMMAAAAGVVLLIACANVASLLLARGIKRQKEIAVRAAIGCSRARLIRQLLTESTLLFLAGGVLGLFFARWSEDILAAATFGVVSNATYLHIDLRAALASLAICLVSALFFGTIPALQATHISPNDSLKDAPASITSGSRQQRSRNLLIMFQVALGMVLLVISGLLFRSFLHVEAAPIGYDPRNVLTATIQLPSTHYASPSARARLMQATLDRLRIMPSVESVGIANSLPMSGADSAHFQMEASSPQAAPVEDQVSFLSVSDSYFSTLRVPMLAGRPFHESDRAAAAPVAIVNQTFASRYFYGTSPIGGFAAFAGNPASKRQIVGVVSDFRQRNPEEDLRPIIYLPIAQTSPAAWSAAIRVRSSTDLATAAQSISNWLRPVDPSLDWEVGTMQRQLHDSESLTLRRPIITLFGGFGGLALILAIVGIFGVTSYSVAERTREIGIRVALGAARGEIANLVLRDASTVAFAGIAIGSFAALVLTKFLPTGSIGWSGSGIFLYGVSRLDALTYICSAALLLLASLSASWPPARRATQIDPLQALRHE
ncbi:MAG TPA: ABC transporter permease [Candidatus Acidoferrum sp.]